MCKKIVEGFQIQRVSDLVSQVYTVNSGLNQYPLGFCAQKNLQIPRSIEGQIHPQ